MSALVRYVGDVATYAFNVDPCSDFPVTKRVLLKFNIYIVINDANQCAVAFAWTRAYRGMSTKLSNHIRSFSQNRYNKLVRFRPHNLGKLCIHLYPFETCRVCANASVYKDLNFRAFTIDDMIRLEIDMSKPTSMYVLDRYGVRRRVRYRGGHFACSDHGEHTISCNICFGILPSREYLMWYHSKNPSRVVEYQRRYKLCDAHMCRLDQCTCCNRNLWRDKCIVCNVIIGAGVYCTSCKLNYTNDLGCADRVDVVLNLLKLGDRDIYIDVHPLTLIKRLVYNTVRMNSSRPDIKFNVKHFNVYTLALAFNVSLWNTADTSTESSTERCCSKFETFESFREVKLPPAVVVKRMLPREAKCLHLDIVVRVGDRVLVFTSSLVDDIVLQNLCSDFGMNVRIIRLPRQFNLDTFRSNQLRVGSRVNLAKRNKSNGVIEYLTKLNDLF